MCCVTIIISSHLMAEPMLQQGSWPRYSPAGGMAQSIMCVFYFQLLPTAPASLSYFLELLRGCP